MNHFKWITLDDFEDAIKGSDGGKIGCIINLRIACASVKFEVGCSVPSEFLETLRIQNNKYLLK